MKDIRELEQVEWEAMLAQALYDSARQRVVDPARKPYEYGAAAICYSLNKLAADAHDLAVSKGFVGNTFGEDIALIHSELSEALEAVRSGAHPNTTWYADKKPEGVPSELADAMIRILAMCGRYGIDIGAILLAKHAYNKTRPHKHGKAF